MSVSTIEGSLGEMLQCLRARCPNLCPAIFPTRFCPKSLSDFCVNDHQRKRIFRWEAEKGAPTVRFETTIDVAQSVVTICGVIDESNETDCLLGNLEAVMALLASGLDEEIEVARARFLQVNQHQGEEKNAEHRIFVEAYNIAYAIKVLLSNMPMQLVISTQKPGSSAASKAKALRAENCVALPLDEDTKLEALFDDIVQRNQRQKSASPQQQQAKSPGKEKPGKTGGGEGGDAATGAASDKRKMQKSKSAASSDEDDSDEEEEEEETTHRSKKPRTKKRSGKKSKQ
jgi:hypothetical protein